MTRQPNSVRIMLRFNLNDPRMVRARDILEEGVRQERYKSKSHMIVDAVIRTLYLGLDTKNTMIPKMRMVSQLIMECRFSSPNRSVPCHIEVVSSNWRVKMDTIQSTYQPFLTLDYIVNESENKLFDRKSSRIKPGDLAPIISAFANAEGGTIVIGVDDKKKAIEGLSALSSDQVNDLVSAPKDTCIPMPQYHEEFLTVTNKTGKTDKLLLLHIEASHEQVIRTVASDG